MTAWLFRGKARRIPYTEFTRDEILVQVRRMREYDALRRLIGDYADETVSASYRYLRGALRHDFRIYHGRDATAPDINMIRDDLVYEREMFLSNRQGISDLWRRGMQGDFSDLLRVHAEEPSDYGADPLDSDLVKAAKWVFGPSRNMNPHFEDEFKIKFALESVLHRYDVRLQEAAQQLHQLIVPQAGLAPDRSVRRGTWYCGTGGGRALQDGMQILAEGFELEKDDENPLWDDLACFLYGANVRAQAFTDGNKRASRAIYAAAMLKGNRPFMAPGAALERILLGRFRM